MVTEKYFWAFANGEDTTGGSRTICVVNTETFLEEGDFDYFIPHEVTEELEDHSFFETEETYYQTDGRTDKEIKEVLDELEFISYNEDFQKFVDSNRL